MDRTRADSAYRRHLFSQGEDLVAEDGPFVLRDVDRIAEEGRTLKAALPHPPGRRRVRALSQKTMVRNAIEVSSLARFGEPPTVESLRSALAPLPASRSRELHVCLAQIHLTLHHAQRFHGRDYDPTRLVLVNPRWDRRWENLLSGTLCVAWVGHLSVDDFQGVGSIADSPT